MYSSSDGSGWYCMPEIGDTVRVYCPDGDDGHAYAISSVHESVNQGQMAQSNFGQSTWGGNSNSDTANSPTGTSVIGNYSGLRDDPDVKSIRSVTGKEIRLTPDGVYIIADGTVIALTDEEGVSIISENDISFTSEKNIILCAKEQLQIIGKECVDITSGDTAQLRLEENVEIIGQEVKSN